MTVRVTQPPIDIPSARRKREREQAATFKATSQWQDVPENAILPPGLQIQIDMETGRKQARFAQESASNGHAEPATQQEQTNGAAPVQLSTIEARPMNWSWYPYLPFGHISLFASKGGGGKGLVSAALAAAITNGGFWPDGSERAKPGNILWCETEDPIPQVLRPRLEAAGADLDKVFVIGEREYQHLNLKSYIRDHDIRAVILSPLLSFLRKVGEKNDEMQVRAGLADMQSAVENTDCFILGLCHLNKKPDLAALERILGAVAFTNFVRAVIMSAPEGESSKHTFRLAHAKYNCSLKGRDWLYSVFHTGEGSARDQHVKLEWLLPPDGDCDADNMFDRKSKDQARSSTAGEWLVAYLREHGESPREIVLNEGEKAGHTARALEGAMMRARNKGEVDSRRDKAARTAWWFVK